MAAQFRRSIFLINKRFQFRFAFYVCSWMVALSFVYPMIVYSMFDYFVGYMSRDPNGPPVEALHDLRTQIMILLVALQAIFLVITFLVSIFMSHRIAGPLYKLSRFFAAVKEGNLASLKEELYFREKDHFQELAADYNAAMGAVRTQIESAATDVEHALASTPGGAPREQLEQALGKLRGLQR